MLKDKYKFTLDYADLAILSAHLKSIQHRAVIHPHNRPEGKSLELLLCSVLKELSDRIEIKLFSYASVVKIQIRRNEMLAFHCAYKYKWLPYQISAQTVYDTIDKVI